MRKLFRSVIPPLVSLVIVMLRQRLFSTPLPASASLPMEPPAGLSGVMNASYFAGIMIGSIYVERLIDRIAHIRTFAIMASVNSFVFVMQALIIDPVSWTFFRFFFRFLRLRFFHRHRKLASPLFWNQKSGTSPLPLHGHPLPRPRIWTVYAQPRAH